ncbi:MAG: RsmB/NOP family class I SAM-dependent RNA methyltransferase [Sphaerochaeta sp.]|nr:RsmB/NOP family class I SAM-dependent RNA methyltransferase [Sphaerochaeta sp.]
MGKKQKETEGAKLFELHYQNIYAERWPTLRQALLEERKPVAFNEKLEATYYLDEASIIAARLLGVQEGDHVLDMCAAPGGKTLVMASALQGSGLLVANDRSATRRGRLKIVLKNHLPQAWQEHVLVTGHDATKWGLYEQGLYDRVLLDAPCSSERHVLADDKALHMWRPSRPKALAIQQFAMLAAALEAVKVGGLILYSTCSIEPAENEGVIEKLFAKRAGRFAIEHISAPEAEGRPYGSIILPDSSGGRGPLYVCLVRRVS